MRVKHFIDCHRYAQISSNITMSVFTIYLSSAKSELETVKQKREEAEKYLARLLNDAKNLEDMVRWILCDLLCINLFQDKSVLFNI
jgi:hypothetical protein